MNLFRYFQLIKAYISAGESNFFLLDLGMRNNGCVRLSFVCIHTIK